MKQLQTNFDAEVDRETPLWHQGTRQAKQKAMENQISSDSIPELNDDDFVQEPSEEEDDAEYSPPIKIKQREKKSNQEKA